MLEYLHETTLPILLKTCERVCEFILYMPWGMHLGGGNLCFTLVLVKSLTTE